MGSAAKSPAVVDPTGIKTWEQYKSASRTNRGTPLGARQKLTLWRVFETLLQALAKENLTTWNSLCYQTAQSLTVPVYDHVIADEVQDFGPAELRLVRALAAPGKNDILLCGDSGQRIYKSRTSLLNCGLDVRGRSTQLRVNYRTTQQIRRLADSLFSSYEADADGEPLTRDAVSILNGPVPQVAGYGSIADEVSGLAEWLGSRLIEGMKPYEIAIFGRTEAVLHDRAEPALEAAGIKGQLLNDDDAAIENHVSLGTMHRAKGLEFKAVAIVGCDLGVLPLPLSPGWHGGFSRSGPVRRARTKSPLRCLDSREGASARHSYQSAKRSSRQNSFLSRKHICTFLRIDEPSRSSQYSR